MISLRATCFDDLRSIDMLVERTQRAFGKLAATSVATNKDNVAKSVSESAPIKQICLHLVINLQPCTRLNYA